MSERERGGPVLDRLWEGILSGERVERRLTAILAADVVGYSRLMGADEEGTLERVKAMRRELLDPKIAEHRGRIVKTTGDGFLVEFASVVDAVRCAVQVQQAMPERNTDIGADSRLDLRIGINLSDVIVEGDDLYGNGVNIAARIEALADAGGVFVSNTVHDQVRDLLPFVFEDLGEQQVKNIARPVWVYRVHPALTHPVPAERVRGLKAHDAPGSSLSSDRLGKTMANPRYADDLSRLDRIYDRKAVINRETIIIVIGKSIPVELLDRPVAELFRDEIDRKGGKEHPFRRAIVITDSAWYAEARDIGFNAVIAVGGPRSNELTKEFEEKPAIGATKFPISGREVCNGLFQKNAKGLPQVALWGGNALRVREAVDLYTKNSQGLNEFLRMTWK